MASKIIAIDGDGVLLDYHRAYAALWHKAFGVEPKIKDANAYWIWDRYDVRRLSGPELQKFRKLYDAEFWLDIPPIAGALDACNLLVENGFELVCVSAISAARLPLRRENLKSNKFPLAGVIGTGSKNDNGESPKLDAIRELKPVAFVDDYLPYFAGITGCHKALIDRETVGSPNFAIERQTMDSTHSNLNEFANWWCR